MPPSETAPPDQAPRGCRPSIGPSFRAGCRWICLKRPVAAGWNPVITPTASHPLCCLDHLASERLVCAAPENRSNGHWRQNRPSDGLPRVLPHLTHSSVTLAAVVCSAIGRLAGRRSSTCRSLPGHRENDERVQGQAVLAWETTVNTEREPVRRLAAFLSLASVRGCQDTSRRRPVWTS